MYPAESVHKYPRLLTGAIEWLCALLVAITSARIGIIFLRVLWSIYGRNNERVGQIPLLPEIIRWIDGVALGRASTVAALWPALIAALAWSALALFATVVLRNAFPAVRTSAQGMLVEFSGSWLPIPWEGLRAIRVTSDLAGERFVLLVQTNKGQLTTWHRLYSLLYGPRWSAGFYVTSNISEFDFLIQTMLSESERTARASETARPARLHEDTPSPLFRLLLSPGAFFSRSSAADVASSAGPRAPASPGGPVSAAYPSRITALVNAAVLILIVFAGLRYLSYWSSFIALEIPPLRDVAPFSWSFTDTRYIELYNAFRTRPVPLLGIPGRPDLPAPWWILVSAHLSLLLAFVAVRWLRNILPQIESRSDGVAVRDALRGRWQLLPWERVRALKLTEISEQSQIVLLQGRGLPDGQGLTSLLYDGSSGPGVLITSAIGNFQPMLQHALGHIMAIDAGGGQPVLRQEARSPLLWMAFGGRAARDALVAEARDDAGTRVVGAGLLRTARTMAAIALPPALLVLLGGLLSDRAPSLGMVVAALVLWIFGMLEWPLVGLISVLLDDNTGGGEEGYRALYLYPASQLPRLLPLVAAVIFQIVGLPLLPALAWLGAIVWAFRLGMSLWESLYEWTGSQAILGGLLPVFWQLLLLVGYLIAVR